MYEVFIRNWWRKDSKGNLIPDPTADKELLNYCDTEDEARSLCKEYNSENEPGELSRKAEYREV